MKRYMLHPGWVQFRSGPPDWVNAHALAQLYGVREAECVVAWPWLLKSLTPAQFARLIHLYPDSSGAYQLSQPAAERPPRVGG